MILAEITSQASKVRELDGMLILERSRLYALMRRARSEGSKLDAIANAAGITRQRVAQIVNGGE